jgi:hypothetical protein
MDIHTIISNLKKVATFTPEFFGKNILEALQPEYDLLIQNYPGILQYPNYLDFLKLTGGVHIHNQDFSLGIYGFGGYIVASFEEGWFLDQDHFFQFGEVIYPGHSDQVYVFAFDFHSKEDMVYVSPIETSEYKVCAKSFKHLLMNFAAKKYPAI